MKREVLFGDRRIGPGHPVFIIAEAGVNHNGDADIAMAMLEAAAKCGVDAVKFQGFTAERLVSPSADKASHQLAASGEQESQLDLLRRLELPREAYPRLLRRCRELGVVFLCTPFDEEWVDYLDSLGVVGFKVGSGEITNIPFLRHVASKNRPVILSTGMSTLAETAAALEALSDAPGVLLLHCLSAYPGDPAEANLLAIPAMAAALGVPVGFSDHTGAVWMAAAAVSVGAVALERHFTLDRAMAGPDQTASLDPASFAEMVDVARQTSLALGDGVKRVMPGEEGVRAVGRRSLAAAQAIRAGEPLTPEMLRTLRPASGIAPTHFELVIGRAARRDIAENQILRWNDIS